MKRKRYWILALILTWLTVGQVARAASVTVTSTTDVSDGNTSSIANLMATPGSDGVISLREAIEAANNTPGPDTINFNIPGCGGVCAIQPTSALPPLSGNGTMIDGYSQSGAAEATADAPATLLIEINGANAGNSHGFDIISAGNIIKGLVINRFLRSGIFINSKDAMGNIISGNHIGVDAGGTVDLGNALFGIYISYGAQNNIIGGDTAAERNVISGNDSSGVFIVGTDMTSNNIVSGNYIGTDANGTAVLGNVQHGVLIVAGAQYNIIGGNTVGQRNVISGNGQSGVTIYSNETKGNAVLGNHIGVDASGTVDLGNVGYGVYLSDGPQSNIVGPGNIIAYNGSHGVGVEGNNTTGNIITQNSIFANDVGIKLINGASGNIALPVILTTTLKSVNVIGTACPNCTVEVFENSDTDGEGETYVGSATADVGGAFTVVVDSLSDPYLTATATDERGTSEFSEVFTAMTDAPPPNLLYLPFILKNG